MPHCWPAKVLDLLSTKLYTTVISLHRINIHLKELLVRTPSRWFEGLFFKEQLWFLLLEYRKLLLEMVVLPPHQFLSQIFAEVALYLVDSLAVTDLKK